MGFLDHSTNNIIIDAVLTDEGRRLLSLNDNSFNITLFSLADDEVDYTQIKKFGRTVGKEKIAKNTPVFEAQTRSSIAVKNRLVTLPNQTVDHMPVVTLTANTGFDADSNTLTFDMSAGGGPVSRTVTVTQEMNNNNSIPEGLQDSTFTIQVPDRFVTMTSAGASFVSLTPDTRIASHKLLTDSQGATTVTLSFTLQNKSLPQNTFNIFGTPGSGAGGNRDTIESVVSIVGDQSGTRKDINITIRK